MESKDQRCLQILEPIELLLFFSDSRIKMLQYTFFCLLMKILHIFLWLTIEILKKKIPSRPAWQFNSKLLFDIWLVIIKISPPTLDSQYSKLLSDIWMVKIKICAGVTTASHGPSPSTGDNNDNDHTPEFCRFSYTTVLSRPVKSSLKSARIGQNRSNFCHHYAKKYTGLKIDGYERYQLR